MNGLWSSSIQNMNVSVHMFQSNPRLRCIGKSSTKRSRLLTSLVQSSNENASMTAGRFEAILCSLRLEAASIFFCARPKTLIASSSAEGLQSVVDIELAVDESSCITTTVGFCFLSCLSQTIHCNGRRGTIPKKVNPHSVTRCRR